MTELALYLRKLNATHITISFPYTVTVVHCYVVGNYYLICVNVAIFILCNNVLRDSIFIVRLKVFWLRISRSKVGASVQRFSSIKLLHSRNVEGLVIDKSEFEQMFDLILLPSASSLGSFTITNNNIMAESKVIDSPELESYRNWLKLLIHKVNFVQRICLLYAEVSSLPL